MVVQRVRRKIKFNSRSRAERLQSKSIVYHRRNPSLLPLVLCSYLFIGDLEIQRNRYFIFPFQYSSLWKLTLVIQRNKWSIESIRKSKTFVILLLTALPLIWSLIVDNESNCRALPGNAFNCNPKAFFVSLQEIPALSPVNFKIR